MSDMLRVNNFGLIWMIKNRMTKNLKESKEKTPISPEEKKKQEKDCGSKQKFEDMKLKDQFNYVKKIVKN